MVTMGEGHDLEESTSFPIIDGSNATDSPTNGSSHTPWFAASLLMLALALLSFEPPTFVSEAHASQPPRSAVVSNGKTALVLGYSAQTTTTNEIPSPPSIHIDPSSMTSSSKKQVRQSSTHVDPINTPSSIRTRYVDTGQCAYCTWPPLV
jgi:hypothetical protein